MNMFCIDRRERYPKPIDINSRMSFLFPFHNILENLLFVNNFFFIVIWFANFNKQIKKIKGELETHTTHQRGHILKLILIWYGQNKNQIYLYGLKVKVQTSAVHVTWYHPKVQPRI